MPCHTMERPASTVNDTVLDEGAVCLFCGDSIPDSGLGFYDHVDTAPACEFRWKDWMEEIPKDHGGA